MTRQIIRKAIKQLLEEHVNKPFLLLREVGLQARLWCLLQERLTPKVITPVLKARSKFHKHTKDFETSRVHLELKVKLVSGARKQSDIVVLRADRKPTLTCYRGGPTDVAREIDAEDVEAVIEMKAAPSIAPEQRARFIADIDKLDALRRNHPHIQCYFVLIDKSLAVPGAVWDPLPSGVQTWTRELKLQESIDEASGNFVEVWDLAGNPPTPRRRFHGEEKVQC